MSAADTSGCVQVESCGRCVYLDPPVPLSGQGVHAFAIDPECPVHGRPCNARTEVER